MGLSDECPAQLKSRLFCARAEREGKAMKIERRIQALEARLTSEATILYFPDGSTGALHKRTRDELLAAVFRHSISPRQSEQLDLIRQSVGVWEPRGGHMIDVARIMLAASEGGQPVGQSEWDRCEGLTDDECSQASTQGRTATHGSQ